LRELSNRIVTERINDALMNVVKDEYNKKIKIICNESNQNQIKAASKLLILIKLIFNACLPLYLKLIINKYNLLRKNPFGT